MEDDYGNPMIYSYKVRHICNECKQLEPWDMGQCDCCKDKPLEVPHKSSGKSTRYTRIYELANREEMDKNENQGDITTTQSACFIPETVKRAFKMERYEETKKDCAIHIDEIYVAVDPNAAGSDDMGIAIGYIHGVTQEIVVSIFFYKSRSNASLSVS